MHLADKYRPKVWAELIGQPKAMAIINRLRETGGLSGRAYFISGLSGTGKGCLADLLAREVADEYSITDVDGSEVTAELIEDIRRCRQMRPFGKGYCFIIDECHSLKNATVTKLLKLTEKMPSWMTIIFLTTSEAKESLFDECLDASPLLSRCEEIPLARRDLCRPFAERALEIARAEGLDGQPIGEYEKLLKSCGNNLRKALHKIEAGAMIAKGAGNE